jgi:hypothetical protein
MKKNFTRYSVLSFLLLICPVLSAKMYAFVIPNAPSGLVAVAFSPTQINLTWTDNATDETGFELEMSTDGKVFVKIAEVAKDSVTARSTGLKASTAYWYRVRAKNLSGNSLYSNIATATTKAPVVTIPKAPSGLTAIAVSGTQINISWVDNAADETGFELERSIDGLTFAKVTDIGPNVEYFQNIGLAPTTKYWYRILAKNTAGKSAYSNLASATTLQVPPVAPDGLTAEAVSSTQINLSWKDKSSNETRFELERSLNATVFTKISDIPLDMTSYQNTGLTPVTAYYYRIRAVNSAGASPYSNVVSATTQNIPVPDMPQNLTAVPTAPDLIQLRWAALTGNASDVVIERSRDPENDFVHLAKLPANILQYEDRDELEIADYYYRIRAVNAGGSSPYSLVAIVPARTIVTGNEPVAVENVIYIENSILNIELKRSSQARLAVFDVGGRLHKNLAIRQVSQTDLRTFTPGVYLVVVETDREMIRRKILVY